jgi:hypothetical protein
VDILGTALSPSKEDHEMKISEATIGKTEICYKSRISDSDIDQKRHNS